MEKAELTAYAKERYSIPEEHKWTHFPAFSVLSHPETHKWIALLIDVKHPDGTVAPVCDLKCGQDRISGLNKPYLGTPVRMSGKNWISITFGPDTERDVVLSLFDAAVARETPGGYRVVLEEAPGACEGSWHDTAIPKPAARGSGTESGLPAEIVELRRMIRKDRQLHPDAAGTSTADRAASFYVQAKFMENYEDEAPWKGYFYASNPAYRDLTTQQLRGYFSWRTRVRRGEYPKIPVSAAYIYVYELLNVIGVHSAEEALAELGALEQGFFRERDKTGKHFELLRNWMFEFCVLHDLPPETAQKYAAPGRAQRDRALAALRDPDTSSDVEIFEAIMAFSEKTRRESPAIAADTERAARIFAEAWRRAQAHEEDGKDLFTCCFGTMQKKYWYPMWSALYLEQHPYENRSYTLSSSRRYELANGMWYTHAYDRSGFNLVLLRGFSHAVDLALRRRFGAGRALRRRDNERWAEPYIEGAFQAYETERAQATVPINPDHLARIREDADWSRDSLLTDEELAPSGPELAAAEQGPAPADESVPAADTESPLSGVQQAIVRALTEGRPVDDLLAREHMMASIAADAINEALYDLIGDNLVTSDGSSLELVEDYREEAVNLTGGSSDGREE